MEEHFLSSIEIIRRSLSQKGIPEDAIPIMLKSLSEATLKQYTGTFRKWWLYCQQKGLKPFTVNVGNIISFLSDLILGSTSYASLRSHKSPLSLVLNISNSDELILNRFLKGAFRMRPIFSKYNVTWDPCNVLNYIKTWYPLESLSLDKLVKKLVMLLVLATGQRLQTISKIYIKNTVQKEDSIEIFITDMLKTSNYNRLQPVMKFKFFVQRHDLCVAKTLIRYLEESELIRNNEDYLVLMYRKPFRRASIQSEPLVKRNNEIQWNKHRDF